MARGVWRVAVAAECLLTLVWMRILLRFRPRWVLRGVIAPRVDGGDPTTDVAAIQAIFHRVCEASWFGHTCMHRSLALQRILARRGIAATLQIGLGRRPQLLPGHAWLEVGGVIVNDHPDNVARYVPLTISESALLMSYR